MGKRKKLTAFRQSVNVECGNRLCRFIVFAVLTLERYLFNIRELFQLCKEGIPVLFRFNFEFLCF